MLIGTFVYKFLCGHMFSVILGIYLVVEHMVVSHTAVNHTVVGHMGTLCLTF